MISHFLSGQQVMDDQQSADHSSNAVAAGREDDSSMGNAAGVEPKEVNGVAFFTVSTQASEACKESSISMWRSKAVVTIEAHGPRLFPCGALRNAEV